MKFDLEIMIKEVCGVAIDTGDFIRGSISGIGHEDIKSKGVHDYVTYVDKESEQRIVRQLSKLFPGSGFIAEESPALKPAEYTWVIDPLDGTTNFIHGVPLYCVSIGLMKGDEVIGAVVYEPNLKECFYTWGSSPAYLNGQEIRVSGSQAIGDSLFATGFPYYDYGKLDEYLEIFKHLLKNSRGARRLGSAAADLAYVAAGRYDGFFEYGLSPWDVCAGTLLVINAGGRVSDFTGGKRYIFGKQIIATNPIIHQEFLTLFSSWKQE